MLKCLLNALRLLDATLRFTENPTMVMDSSNPTIDTDQPDDLFMVYKMSHVDHTSKGFIAELVRKDLPDTLMGHDFWVIKTQWLFADVLIQPTH